MVEKKLQFSDLREARAVLGMKDEFLKTLQREFPDLTIIRLRSHRQAEDWLGQVERVSKL